MILLEAGQAAEALPFYEQARAGREALVEAMPDRLEVQNALGTTLDELGILHWSLGQPDEALATSRQATAFLRRAYEGADGVPGTSAALERHLLNLAILERESGNFEEAVELLLARQRIVASRPDELYQVAVALASVAEAVGTDQEGDELSAELQEQRRKYRLQAIEVLGAAAAAGFEDWSAVEAETAWEGLREMDEFQALMPSSETP